MIKKITYTIGVIFFLWWFFLSHVTFFNSKYDAEYDEDSGYYIKYVEPLPINFFGAYFWIFNSDAPLFIVLYDKNNNYVGQSTPFEILDNVTVASGNKLFPSEDLPSFSLVDYYPIPIDHKKWWSYILQYFH